MRQCSLTIVFAAAVCLIVFGMAEQASAKPGWGSGCLAGGCHGAGGDMAVDPAQPLTTFAGMNQRTYTLAPGDAVDLLMNVLDGADVYAGVLKGLDGGGVVNSPSNMLAFAPDASWNARGGGSYFTWDSGAGSSGGGIVWPGAGSVVPLTFHLVVDASTPLDVYDLEFGVGSVGNSERYAGEHFFLNVVPEPSTLTLLAVGLGAIGFVSRRRRKKPA